MTECRTGCACCQSNELDDEVITFVCQVVDREEVSGSGNHLAFRAAFERAEASYEEAMAAVTQAVFQRVLAKLAVSESSSGLCSAPSVSVKEAVEAYKDGRLSPEDRYDQVVGKPT